MAQNKESYIRKSTAWHTTLEGLVWSSFRFGCSNTVSELKSAKQTYIHTSVTQCECITYSACVLLFYTVCLMTALHSILMVTACEGTTQPTFPLLGNCWPPGVSQERGSP